MPDLWDKRFRCPSCSAEVVSKKVFTDRIVVRTYDEDLKPNYDGVNPMLYSVVVCENCLYSALESDFEKPLSPVHLADIHEVKGQVKMPDKVNFSGERDHRTAILSYALAVLFYKAKKQICRVAEMYLRMGWLYRELGDPENERKALAKALASFEECYLNSYLDQDREPMVLFYLAQLSKAFGKREEAVRWFSTLITKYRNSNSFYVKAGKERWQDLV